jgi:phospholipase/carboxylesterase
VPRLLAFAVLLVACATVGDALAGAERRGTDHTGPLFVMLHGYGSGPRGFGGLMARTDLPARLEIVCLRAPLETHPPQGPEGGFMWWSFPDTFHDLRTRHFDGVSSARALVSRALDQLGAATRPTVLGGFSQGALLTLDVALHDPRPLAGIVLLSGTLMDRAELAPRVASRAHLPAYLSLGLRDDVLDHAYAAELPPLLREGGLDVRLTEFDGGHEVTPQISDEVAAFVRETLGGGSLSE